MDLRSLHKALLANIRNTINYSEAANTKISWQLMRLREHHTKYGTQYTVMYKQCMCAHAHTRRTTDGVTMMCKE